MAQLMEYAEYLSKEIGPRPAGTEEEQQAALYITERFQKDAGFSAQIEEFTSSSNIEGISALPGLVVIVVAILGMIFPVLAIPAFILAAAAAALYTLEAFGRPVVTRALARGASQNVVAKYQPNPDAATTARGRSRKIVLVAHYDSGKVTPSLVRTVESAKLPVPIGLVCVGGIVLAAFFLLLHVFVNTGVPGIIVNVLTVVALIVCAYPVIRAILYRTAPYNEGANNNATGTAALMEVARRISRGSVSEADLASDPEAYGVSIHGEQAARESGLVPEGVQIRYEAERLVPPSELGEYDEEERLLAAKAAIAAMTGQPVERKTFGTVATHLVNSRAQGEDPVLEFEAAISAGATDSEPQRFDEAASGADVGNQQEPIAAPAAEPVAVPVAMTTPVASEPAQTTAEGFENAPSWFVAAQQNAKKSEKPGGETGPVQRSRYAEAIEAAEREAAAREQERAEEARLQQEAELRRRGEAARAAIEQAQASKPAEVQQEQIKPAPEPESEEVSKPEIAVEPQEAAEPVAVPEQIETPVFVPYHSQEPVVEAKPVESVPTDDEFAESLGKTTAFDPHQLQAYEAAAGSDVPATADDANQALSRLASLPVLETSAPATEAEPRTAPETTSPSRSGMFRKLRADVPSMSGVIRMQEAGEDVSQLPVQQSAPVREPREPRPVAASEASQAPVHEPVPSAPATSADDVDYDMRPADLAGYGEGNHDRREEAFVADTGNYAIEDYENYEEPGKVEMPKSRTGGFLGRFRRKKNEPLDETPQEWLDVDEDFDARTVGRERGGWESFRDDARDNREGDEPRGRKWEGGSYSRVRLGRVDTRSGEDAEADVPSEPVEFEEDRQIADEIEQIYHFRNPLYNTEVWFVALGSEGAAHDGAKAFLAEHADELKGSMIIEVESLGAGELAVASAEGRIKRVAASSRVKRYTRTATAATGIAPGSVDLTGSDSASSILQAAGYQSMHLLGVENGAPALKGSPDDIMENVDDLLLDDNVNFLMELLKK